MEIKNNHNLRYFELVDKGDRYHINSPLLEAGLKTFKEKRLFYLRFIRLEKNLNKSWSARTDLNNKKMRVILEKLGAIPFHIDADNNKIYYLKAKKNEDL
jgi:hypothetical protein